MKRIPAFITLAIITLVAAILLAVTDNITREPISAASVTGANSARFAVLPAAESFEPLENAESEDALFVGIAGGQTVGHTASITVQGFAGPIELTVGMDTQGLLTGLSVGGSGFSETAGLGSKAKEPEFTGQFIGKTVPVVLGSDIDAISGATITSRAVTEGVNRAAVAIGTETTAPADIPDSALPEEAGTPAVDSPSSATPDTANTMDVPSEGTGEL